MKKNLIFSAMAFAALAFAGCSQDDTFNESPAVNNAIEFGTYVGRDAVSRASEITGQNLKTSNDGFGVFAYYTGISDFSNSYLNDKPNFMNNTQVTYKTIGSWTGWEYEPGKYWPSKPEKLSFFAYAPYNANAAYSDTKQNIKIPFEVKNTIADQVDLVYATQINQTKPDNGNEVKFTFKHTLSRIAVTAQYAVNNEGRRDSPWIATTVSIKKVKLTCGKMKSDDTFEETPFFFKDGDLQINAGGTFNWLEPTNTKGRQSFTWDFTSSPRVLQNDPTNPVQPVTNENEYLMVIPWSVWDDYDLYVEVEYTVETTDPTILNGKSKIDHKVLASVPNLRRFEAGKAYKLNLKLGMDWVVAEAQDVASWDTSTSTTNVTVK